MQHPISRVRLATGVALCFVLATCGGVPKALASSSPEGARTPTKIVTNLASRLKPVPVTMFGGEPGAVQNLKTNWFTKYAERTFGLKMNLDLVTSDDVATKQSLLLASGKYPDVIWNGSISYTDAYKFGTQGVFVPLNGLIKKYAPTVWRQMHTLPGTWKT